jgi:hypothetical protein
MQLGFVLDQSVTADDLTPIPPPLTLCLQWRKKIQDFNSFVLSRKNPRILHHPYPKKCFLLVTPTLFTMVTMLLLSIQDIIETLVLAASSFSWEMLHLNQQEAHKEPTRVSFQEQKNSTLNTSISSASSQCPRRKPTSSLRCLLLRS